MRRGQREWLRIRGRGMHHFYVQTLAGFVQKRRRATVHFLRVQEETKTNWMKEKPPVPLWLAGVYCVTFAGPFWHTVRGPGFATATRAGFGTCRQASAACLVMLGGVWAYKRGGRDEKLIAKLKPKQALK